MAKKVVAEVKLQIPAGKATPAPPVGPALGQHGVNIGGFCKEFNDKTAKEDPDLIFPVIITVYNDRTFTFVIKTPPASILVKKACGLKSGAANSKKDKVGKISQKKLEELAKQKMEDLNAASLEAAVSMLKGTARSMGVVVVDEESSAS